jgi:hypothetical protein
MAILRKASELVVAQLRRVLVLVLSRKALTNTSFTSVAELETRIDCWVSHCNDNPGPSVWTKLADEILDKVARGQATLDQITKSATRH